MNRKEDQLLVNELFRLGLLDKTQLAKIEQFSENHLNRLGLTKVLVFYFHLDESRVAKVISELFNIPLLEEISGITWKDLEGVERLQVAEKLKIAPIIQTKHELTIASNNPPYAQLTAYLHKQTNKEVTNVVLKTSFFESICTQINTPPQQSKPMLNEFDKLDVEKRGEAWAKRAEQSADLMPPKKLLEKIIKLAMTAGASDIHFNSTAKNYLTVKYRLDDVIINIVTLPQFYKTSLFSILKHHGKLDSFKKEEPQEGHFTLSVDNTDVHARISFIPTSYGENSSLRILTKSLNLMNFEDLGLTIDSLMSFRQLLAAPDGIVFFSGPAGCGKTTTLYSALQEFSKSLRIVSTVENPIEHLVDGITQTQEAETENEKFIRTVRTIFHHDVDILALGEIRKNEQLKLLVEAGFTGMLACSTVQSTNAIQTIYRLANLGLSFQELALVLRGITSQRFVRKICPYCITDYRPDASTLKLAGLMNLEPEVKLKKGNGCSHCLRTGYLGKIPIFEILLVNNEISSMIYNEKSYGEIYHAASAVGFKNMRYDGLVKALAGLTTLEEVLRVTL